MIHPHFSHFINVIPHINKGQKSHYDLNRCIKSIWQNPTLLHDKNSQETGSRREFSQQGVYKKPTAIITFNGVMLENDVTVKRLNTFSLRTRQGSPLSPLLFNIVLEFLAREIGQENIYKMHPDWKGKSKTFSMCRWHDLIYSKS